MKVALSQMDMAWLDIPANLRKISETIDEAEQLGVELLVFPEMALTGFCMDTQSATLELGSPEIRQLAAMTRDKKLLVLIGAAMRSGSRFTNDCLVLRNGEVIASYSKMNLFPVTGEEKHYEPGHQMLTIEYQGYRITPLICFDSRFMKPFITGAAARTDAFVIMASWPDAQSAQWKTTLSARAMDTQTFVFGVNRTGTGGGLSFAGECNVIAPSGKPMLPYSSDEKLLVADVDLSYPGKLRERFPMLAAQHAAPGPEKPRTVAIHG
ncbi:MAG: hypothetical protein NDJ90_12330 [Oligoflexia bacterium]|nr:hypothetical protein [Oligoflexia bacterium]